MRLAVDVVVGALVGGVVWLVLHHGMPRFRRPARGGPDTGGPLELVPPTALPTFEHVGGMSELKQEMRDTVGALLKDATGAEDYQITWNGLLLHGPPGSGKTFFVRALAGEFGCNLLALAAADVGGDDGAGAVRNAFAVARRNLPCIVFFDEFDAIARDRRDHPAGRDDEVVAQLLHSLVTCRDEPRLLVVAATNQLDALDPSIRRPGRFDHTARVDLPDADARAAIFAAALRGRPVHPEVDVQALARRTTGQSAAAIAQVVESAALAAFRERAGTGSVVRIDGEHLAEALEQRGGRDRPNVEHWSWDRLVLDPATIAELQEIQKLIEDPERSARLGVDAPSGVLLYGPPGTGKTTIGKILAAEAACSFYPVSAATITSKWMGESEQTVHRIFQRAREQAPSIVFLDEIDAVASRRGEWGPLDRLLGQLLLEIDGINEQPGIFVLGATNRPEAVDPALLRGGRLSRLIHIPLPSRTEREALLRLFSRDMPLGRLDVGRLAAETEGFSGADLAALCQQAALGALVRSGGDDADVTVTRADFARALALDDSRPAGPRRRQLRAP